MGLRGVDFGESLLLFMYLSADAIHLSIDDLCIYSGKEAWIFWGIFPLNVVRSRL